ncbi:MAG: ATP-binding protein, partial [Bacteroidia bacterium]|nr:ATP-binding protein [Bacteroidia bacterium]
MLVGILMWLTVMMNHLVGQTLPSRLPTQAIAIEHITAKEGLASEKVISVAQDHQGFLWIGTQEGLHRYDGYELVLYQHDPEDSLSLTNSTAETVFVDRSGTLWVGTLNGLNRYDPETNTFKRYSYSEVDSSSISYPNIHDMKEDAEGRLWIATGGGGVCRYDPLTDAFVRYQYDPNDPGSLSHNVATVLYLDREGVFWVGTGSPWDLETNRGGLNRYDPNLDAFERFEHIPSDPHSLSYNEISAMYEDRAGRFWVANWGDGLQLFDRERGVFQDAETSPDLFATLKWPLMRTSNGPNGTIRFFHEDAEGILWIGGFLGGLDRYDPIKESITHFGFDRQTPHGLSDNAVWSVFQDRHQVLWVSTWKGLNKINPAPSQFEWISSGKQSPFGLHEGHVEEILSDAQGLVWVGTWSGLECYDPVTSKSKKYEIGETMQGMVLALHETEEHELWVGTLQYGLALFDRRSYTFNLYNDAEPDSDNANNRRVTRIHENPSGELWVIENDQLKLFSPKNKRFIPVPAEVESMIVFSIAAADGQRIWLGNDQGLDLFDPSNGVVKSFLRGFVVRCVLPDEKGGLWLGVDGQGLIHFDPATGEYDQFTTREGLPSQTIRALVLDDTGKLWISTNYGLAWMSFHPTQIHTFTPANAPPIQEFYPESVTKTASGHLIFGGNGGYIRFDPHMIQADPVAPNPVLTGLRLFNQQVDFRKLHDSAQPIAFNHDQNDLTFEYAGLHFIHPEENTYRYLLENYEKDWRYVGTQRSAIYPNLPPGSYTFRVQAANQDGIWSEESAALMVQVLPPWWQTGWAGLLFGVLLVAGVYGVHLFQRNRLLQKERSRANLQEARLRTEVAESKAQQLKELDEAKANLYANITHEFRTPLTVIMGMVEEIGGYEHERTIISRNSQNLLRLINQLLDLAKLDSGSLKVNLVQGNILHYLQYLTESFYSMAGEKHLRLTFYSEIEELVMDFDEEKIQHIIYNLLSNAIKFTDKGGKVVLHATVVTMEAKRFLQLKVQDTGCGISPDQLSHIFDRFYQADTSHIQKNQGTGIGLALTRELIDLMEGRIDVVSKPGKGTTFTLLLPVLLQPETPILVRKTVQKQPGLSQAAFPPTETPGIDEGSQPEHEKPVLLLIEDNADVVRYIVRILEQEYHIHTAPNGQLGIEQAWEIVPDIIISDVMMPEKNGYEVCATLKADERSSHIPIILLTAKATVDARIEGLKVGADAYLVKPFHKEELFVRLAKLVELRKAIQARYAGAPHFSAEGEAQNEPSLDDLFLQKLITLVENRLDDSELSVSDLCRAVGLSNTQVNRKLKALTGKTPSQFIRSIRLQRAME